MKNGKFVGWYLRYVDADGQRKQRAKQAAEFAEARRMLIEIEAGLPRSGRNGERSRPEPLTLDALCSRFVDLHSDPRVKDRRAYQVRVRKLLRRVTLHAPDVAKGTVPAWSCGVSEAARWAPYALSSRYGADHAFVGGRGAKLGSYGKG